MQLNITKQVAAKLTSFGFANNPREAVVSLVDRLTDAVRVYRVKMTVPEADIYALVVHKGHAPVEAAHVVDFRVGGNIY
jgi:hypothetical protein